MPKETKTTNAVIKEITDKLISDLQPQEDVRAFIEPMITKKNLQKRWPGLTLSWLAYGIDDSCDATNPTVINASEAMTDFPKAFLHIATVYDENEKKIFLCKSIESDYAQGKPYIKPYIRKPKPDSRGNRYKFKKLLFRSADVKAYEQDFPELRIPRHALADICIPKTLWVGKNPKTVIDGMREAGFAEYCIVHVLFNWCGETNKTAIGKSLKKDDGSTITDSGYSKYVQRLIDQAEEYEITTD